MLKIMFLIIILAPLSAQAFVCKQQGYGEFTQANVGSKIIYLQAKNEVQPNENIVFDSGSQIECRNTNNFGIDWMVASIGTELDPFMTGFFNAKIIGAGLNTSPSTVTIPLPVRGEHYLQGWSHANGGRGYLQLKLELSPIGDLSGFSIFKNQKIATFTLIREFHAPGAPLDGKYFVWDVYSANDVVISTGGCDVNIKSVNVLLGDYPVEKKEKDVNLSVKCAKNSLVSFSLNGKTDTPSLFSNVSSISPATGIGVEIIRNGKPIQVNTDISLGSVGNSFKSLDLKARYALNGKQLRPGNVQSVIGVNFTYN